MPAAWVEGAAAIYGAYNTATAKKPGSTGGAGANMYTPTGLGAADTSWQQNQATDQSQLGANGGLNNISDQGLYQSYQQANAINYQPYQQQQNQLGASYGQAGQQLQQAGQQMYQTAFDPQQALYNRTQQQVGDQANAISSMYGLGQSGAGAGMAQQANENFNIDWQNQQLQRQTQGAQGMAALSQAGLGDQAQASQIPLTAQQYIAAQPGANSSAYASGLATAMAPYQQQQNQAIPYMNYGSGAGANAYANTLQGNQFQAQQQAGALQGLGNAVGGLNTPNSSGQTPWSSLSSWFNSPSYASPGQTSGSTGVDTGDAGWSP